MKALRRISPIVTASLVFMTPALMQSCTGNANEKNESAQSVSSAMAPQPLENGVYEASYYNIEGKGERKGNFDGRVMVSLDQNKSVIFVYENGNRAKIRYILSLDTPFKKDSVTYYSAASANGNVVLNTASQPYSLTFSKGVSQITIDFDSLPKSTGTAFEMLERINNQINQDK